MAWATCGEPHAFLYHQTILRLPSPLLYLPSPLYDLAFILVRSCFHILHGTPILFLLYRVPATSYYPFSFFNNFFLHTSYLIYLLPRRPQTQNSAPSCFWLSAHNGWNSISLGFCPGAHFWGVLYLAPLIFLFGAWVLCPFLPIFTAAPRRREGVEVPGLSLYISSTSWSFSRTPNMMFKNECHLLPIFTEAPWRWEGVDVPGLSHLTLFSTSTGPKIIVQQPVPHLTHLHGGTSAWPPDDGKFFLPRSTTIPITGLF